MSEIEGLGQVAARLPELISETKGLKDEVAGDRTERAKFEKVIASGVKSNRNTNRLLLGLVALLTVFVVLVGWGVWALIDGRTASRGLLGTISDCTDTKGTCYQESQTRTAQVIGDLVKQIDTDANARTDTAIDEVVRRISEGNATVINCAITTDTTDDLLACVSVVDAAHATR